MSNNTDMNISDSDNRLTAENFGKSPIFMPDATRGSVRGVTAEQLKATGTKAIVVNTLHLMIYPGHEKIAQLGGVKKFMNWDGLALSDSGGFQVFSLLHTGKWQGKVDSNGAVFKSPRDGNTHELTPEISIDVQMALGTDIMIALDDCRDAQVDRHDAEQSVDRTVQWAKRARKHFDEKYKGNENGKKLVAVVQGANYLDLREQCAKSLVEIGFDGYSFGGYVVNDDGELVTEEMDVVSKALPDDKFKYAMGVGKPEDIIAGHKLGYNVFDTVLPSRNARHGTLYLNQPGYPVLRVKNSEYANDTGPIDPDCDCEACRNYSRAYLHHMLKVGEMIGYTLATIHNLAVYQKVIKSLPL